MNIFETFESEAEIDFHDYNLLYDFEIERVLNIFIEDTYHEGKNKLLVITGKGEVVRPVVEKILKEHELVKNFKMAGYFNGQDGAFEVYLID